MANIISFALNFHQQDSNISRQFLVCTLPPSIGREVADDLLADCSRRNG